MIPDTSHHAANLRGSLFMVLAMLAFTLEDVFIKAAAAHIPLGQVMVTFGLGGLLVFVAMARLRGEVILHPQAFGRAMAWRALFEITGRVCYTVAIALTPLSSASAILQATPLVVAAGAVMVFRETVGWRQWAAIGAGFVGVLLILRPGLDAFEPLSLFAVLGMIGFAGRDLATRAAPKSMTTAQLGVYGFIMLSIAGGIVWGYQGGVAPLGGGGMVLTGPAILFGVAAYMCLTMAMRTGQIAVIAPFRYTRLVFAMILAVAVFGERPDALTLIGSVIIVASGLYTVWQSRRV